MFGLRRGGPKKLRSRPEECFSKLEKNANYDLKTNSNPGQKRLQNEPPRFDPIRAAPIQAEPSRAGPSRVDRRSADEPALYTLTPDRPPLAACYW